MQADVSSRTPAQPPGVQDTALRWCLLKPTGDRKKNQSDSSQNFASISLARFLWKDQSFLLSPNILVPTQRVMKQRKRLLCIASCQKSLPANIRKNAKSGTPDLHTTTILREDLKDWCRDNEAYSESIKASGQPDYLNRNHPRYAPKPAAAVKVWLVMEDETLLRKKKPFQALDKWPKGHASGFCDNTE